MGKGGGALSAWLKEFTALVFTQTIQAFIYAIIISIILFGMSSRSGISADDNNAALGLMATFALLSVFKVEEMARKIFGVGDTKASHKNAIKSIAKTAIAAKLGKRVLDNTGKVLGGVRAINKSRQDNRKTRTRLQEDMQDLGFNYDEKTNTTTFVGKGKGAGSTVTGASGSGIGSVGNVNVGGSASGGSVDVSADISEAASNIGNAVSGGDTISAADKRRIRNAVRTYNDKMDEIKKARDEGIKSIASGIAESVTSPIGAVAGGLLGGADGNIDEMLQGIMAGAGVGDVVGKSAIDAIDRATKFVQRQANHKPGISSKELKKAISSFESAASSMNVNYGSSSVDDI